MSDLSREGGHIRTIRRWRKSLFVVRLALVSMSSASLDARVMSHTFVPLPSRRSERRVLIEQTSGEGCSNGRPVTLIESGRFRFCGSLTPSCGRAAYSMPLLPSFGARSFFGLLWFWFHHFPFFGCQLPSQRRELARPLQPLPAIHGHDFSIYIPGAIAN